MDPENQCHGAPAKPTPLRDPTSSRPDTRPLTCRTQPRLMGWRQTTILMWLGRLRDALALGASAENPIEVEDDYEDAEPVDDGGGANNPIAISDSEDESTVDGDDNTRPPVNVPESWPPRVPYWTWNRGLQNATFANVDFDSCSCTHTCVVGECVNASSAVFCADTNCTAGESCGNRLMDCESLKLTRCVKGIGVTTTQGIPPRTIIGEYCGYISLLNNLTVKQRSRGFVLKMRSRDTSGARVVIDAVPGGSLCRFVNHSCSPNSRFEERQHRATRRMVIVTEREILPGEEITVLYSKRVSFTCLCGEENCQTKGPSTTSASNYIHG